MMNDTIAQAEQSLSQLGERFEHWRQTRAHGHEPIPQSLWDEAVALSRVLANSRVAKQLRLSPSDLKKRRLAQSPPGAITATAAPSAFVELTSIAPWQAQQGAPCLLEIERADGTRMRLRYEQAPPLASLMQAFWDQR